MVAFNTYHFEVHSAAHSVTVRRQVLRRQLHRLESHFPRSDPLMV